MAVVCLGLWMKWPPADLSCRLAALLEQAGGCGLSDVNTAERQGSSVTVRSVARWLWSTQHGSSLQWSSRRGARSTAARHVLTIGGCGARSTGTTARQSAVESVGRYPVILAGVDVGAVGDVHDAGDLVRVPAGVGVQAAVDAQETCMPHDRRLISSELETGEISDAVAPPTPCAAPRRS